MQEGMLDVKEMRRLKKEDPQALWRNVESLRREYFRLKMESKTVRVQHPHKLKNLKREVARSLTILNEPEHPEHPEHKGKKGA